MVGRGKKIREKAFLIHVHRCSLQVILLHHFILPLFPCSHALSQNGLSWSFIVSGDVSPRSDPTEGRSDDPDAELAGYVRRGVQVSEVEGTVDARGNVANEQPHLLFRDVAAGLAVRCRAAYDAQRAGYRVDGDDHVLELGSRHEARDEADAVNGAKDLRRDVEPLRHVLGGQDMLRRLTHKDARQRPDDALVQGIRTLSLFFAIRICAFVTEE
jgi:hypothetical protein